MSDDDLRPLANIQDDDDRSQLGPSDRHRFVYYSFAILGISGLLPWNLFITAHDYFTYKFHIDNDSDHSSGAAYDYGIERSFEAYFTFTGAVSGVFATIGTAAFGSSLLPNLRMLGSHIVVIAALIVSVAFTVVSTDSWHLGFLILNLILIVIGQVGCNVIIATSLGMAAELPNARYTKISITAQGLCGVFVSIISIVSIGVGAASQRWLVGTVYFATALVYMLFSTFTYLAMLKSPFFKYYVKLRPDTAKQDGDVDSLIKSPRTATVERETRVTQMRVILMKTWRYGMVLICIFTATLSCFPSVTSLVQSTTTDEAWRRYFIPVACFLLFNTMDFIGRLLVSYVLWPKKHSYLLPTFALMRFAFIFIFLLCNINADGARFFGLRMPIVFDRDVYFIGFIFLLGVSNGYLTNLVATYLPECVSDEEKQAAGAMTSFYIAVGVLLGSTIGLLIVKTAID